MSTMPVGLLYPPPPTPGELESLLHKKPTVVERVVDASGVVDASASGPDERSLDDAVTDSVAQIVAGAGYIFLRNFTATIFDGTNWYQVPCDYYTEQAFNQALPYGNWDSHLGTWFAINPQSMAPHDSLLDPIAGTNGHVFVVDSAEANPQARAQEILDSLGYASVSPREVPNPLPASFSLGQNYPNPFNPSTFIPFTLYKPASRAGLEVYNIQGQLISRTEMNNVSPGENAFIFDGSGLPSGQYLYRVQVGGQLKAGRMQLLK